MNTIKQMTTIMFGFSSGIVIAGAVFAFIAIIGVVPRLAQKTRTIDCIVIYEEAIILGGIFGISTEILNYYLFGSILVGVIFAFCAGVFFGCLAVSLAEVLDVIPILTRRTRILEGMKYFVLALAIGKFIGSIVYFLIPGFYDPN